MIAPAIRAVSRTMARWVALIFWLRSPVSPPSTRTPMPNTGMSSQCRVTPNQTRKPMPTMDEYRMLTAPSTKRSVSVRTFWRRATVSPLLRSPTSWNERRSVWRRPSSNISVPTFWVTSRST